MVAAITVIIVLLLVAVAAGVAWNNSRRSVPPGPQHHPLPPGSASGPRHQPPLNGPGFTPMPRSAGGSFQEITRTGRDTPPSPPPRTAAQTTSFGTTYINLTAVCKLTGKQMTDCTCQQCTHAKKKV